MYQKYIDKLEFNKVIDILLNFCNTDVGKDIAFSLQPSTDKNTVSKLLSETTEATKLIFKKHLPDFANVSNITNITKILNGYGVLNIASLLEISKILRLSNSLKNYYNDDVTSRRFSYFGRTFFFIICKSLNC